MPEPHLPLPGCTCNALRRLTRTVTRLYDLHMAQAGLKTTQYSLLKTIAHEPLPIAALASRFATERTTLTRTLRPLVAAGWVTLEAGSDSRQKIVTITAGGRDAIQAGKIAWRHAQAELESTLGINSVRSLHLQLDSALRQLGPILEGHTHANEH